MNRRIMSLFIVLIIALMLPSYDALAAEEFEIQTTRAGSVVLVKYNGSGGAVVIPDGITTIGRNAFSGCETITSVVIPGTVTFMQEGPFKGCKSLASVVIPDSLTNISKGAFYECYALKTVVIGKGVTKIESSAFTNCDSLTSIVIPDSVVSIGVNAFYKCDLLKEVVIGDGVVSIDTRAFYDCPSLKYITIGKGLQSVTGNPFYSIISPISRRTIYGTPGTYAQKFAEQYHYKFVALGSPPPKKSEFPRPSQNVALAQNPGVATVSAEGYIFDHSADEYSAYGAVPYLQTVTCASGNVSVLFKEPDAQNKIHIHEFSPAMKFLKSVSFARELDMVGAYTRDKDGNYYIIYGKVLQDSERGQKNIALIKYSPSGMKLAEFWLVSDYDGAPAGVKFPFDHAACRLEISGDVLAAYFGRGMFNGHQASFGFMLDIKTREQIHTVGEGRSMSLPYVSHSFNQFILPTDAGFAFVDQGDANPRAFLFSDTERRVLGNNKITSFEFYNPDLTFTEPSLYNQTYAEMGGLAETPGGYIFAGTYDKSKPGDGYRNLFLLIMDDELETISDPIWLTKYTSCDVVSPKLVRIAQDRYLLMWRANKNTYMAIVNDKGKVVQTATKLPGVTLNAYDVLRYNPVTGLVHWAVAQDGNAIALYGLDPYSGIKTAQ